jgi:hypothetical protein
MNANELAQEFEEYLKEIEELPWGNHQILCDQAATMLRQQQERLIKYELRNIYQCDRIAILEAQLKKEQE